MIAAISLMRRRPDITLDAFRRHWLHPHGTMTAELPGTRFYVQHHPVASPIGNEVARRLAIDGIPELWFDDYAARHRAYASPCIAACNVDSEHFVGEVTRLVTEPLVVVAPPPMVARAAARPPTAGPDTARQVKVLLLATGTPDTAWADRAEARLARAAGVVGYVRQRLLEQAAAPASRIAELQLTVAGLAEVTFADEAALMQLGPALPGEAGDAARTAVIRVEDFRLV